MPRLEEPIELFYPGTHTDFRGRRVTVPKTELEAAVSWFNANNQQLPLVVGHPDNEDDHFGVGTRLEMKGDRVVIAEVERLEPTFAKIVNSGELPRVSAKIRLAGHIRNKSGGLEFQHAGFFGKSRVALDKLREAAFSADDREFLFMDDLEDREVEFAAQRAEFEREMAAFRRMQAIEPELENLVREGKVLPGEKGGFVALFAAMPEDLEILFAAPGGEIKQSGTDFLKGFLKSLKPRVTYGEVSGLSKDDGNSKSVSFAAYHRNVEGVGLDLVNRAIASGADPSDSNAFVNALKKVSGGQ